MADNDPLDLLFGGMAKLGPGSDSDTLHVLRGLPRSRFDLVVDAGCGTGRQTLVLARELRTRICAIDSHQPFLDELARRAERTGVASLIRAHCMDMSGIGESFARIDLLWSEGAAYNLGFANALALWAPAISRGGLAVVSELAWLQDDVPSIASDFFRTGYPDMKPSRRNAAIAEAAGYRLLGTHTVPRHAWVDGYYEILEPRAKGLVDHRDPRVRTLAQATLREIDVFSRAGDSYGYVFYVLERA